MAVAVAGTGGGVTSANAALVAAGEGSERNGGGRVV